MKKTYLTAWVLLLALCFSACNYVTYTPRTKRQKQLAKPSVVLLENIVHFRETYNEWPSSKDDFTSRGTRYKESFQGFRYLYTQFKIADADNMTFYFDQHVQDVDNYKTTQQTDLNAYRGEVKFYKEKGKFVWKLKMY